MARRPRPITDYLAKGSPLNSLLTQEKANNTLLVRIRQNVPSTLAEHCLGAVLQDNQLLIFVESSAWASKLRFLSRGLCQKMRKEGVPIDKVVARVFLHGQLKPKKKRVSKRELTASNAALINQTAESIADPELRAALKRLSNHRQK